MSRQQKMLKLMRKKDQLIELPEGILYTIISKLALKDAVRTSSLSKAWRFVWTCHPHLLLNSDNVPTAYPHSIQNSQPDSAKLLHRLKFIEQVDRIMKLRIMGSKLDSLTIHYNLGEDCASHIDKWIHCAVMKGVEEINLDLSEQCGSIADGSSSMAYEQYTFPCSLLASSANNCTIKHLQLASCSLSQITSCLKSVVTIVLRDVKISDLQMEKLLSICPSLERLVLNNCGDLVNIRFAVPGLRLKFLSILNCCRLQSVYICSADLLVLNYTGQWVKFSFQSVPRLAKVFLSFTGASREEGASYSLSRLAYDLPQLASLNLVCIMSMKNLRFPENRHKFLNIKQLSLTVLPFDDEDELLWVGHILEAFPLLHKLDINLFSSSYIKQPRGINRYLSESPHSHLNQLVINGFNGFQHEVELLKYLLDNLIKLKILVISPCRRLYKGFDSWDEERPSSWFKLKEDVVQWLHAAVAPTVDLQIQY